MEDFFLRIKEFKKTKDYLVAIDTDGCVVDNMSGKQILVFHPLYMEFYGLWDIESYFREVAEYYNLFSVHRGSNRFIALRLILNVLKNRMDAGRVVKENNLKIPDSGILDDFIDFCEKNSYGLSNSSLKMFVDTRCLDLAAQKTLAWSRAVNEVLLIINKNFMPFANVRESLEIISREADIVVVSQTPYDDLFEYWRSYDMIKYLKIICGQETGSKVFQIEMLKKIGGYPDENVLVIGDSYGDFEAATKNNVKFYPVVPGKEENAWKKMPDAFELFLGGKYTAEKQKFFLEEFLKILNSSPAWENPEYDHSVSYREKQELRKSLYKRFNPSGRLLLL
ncbi:MAG: HAD hydrolase-like protein [Candidatus Omnitrophica bacterium]|nr:HAD hydrolase-like protein [Candidatus Omnitrophota bacterium]MCM8827702.1 HAD hydrolase-like protein [Candidatus Omnitrophota bacterium]